MGTTKAEAYRSGGWAHLTCARIAEVLVGTETHRPSRGAFCRKPRAAAHRLPPDPLRRPMFLGLTIRIADREM
jgi:hypothetical protein